MLSRYIMMKKREIKLNASIKKYNETQKLMTVRKNIFPFIFISLGLFFLSYLTPYFLEHALEYFSHYVELESGRYSSFTSGDLTSLLKAYDYKDTFFHRFFASATLFFITTINLYFFNSLRIRFQIKKIKKWYDSKNENGDFFFSSSLLVFFVIACFPLFGMVELHTLPMIVFYFIYIAQFISISFIFWYLIRHQNYNVTDEDRAKIIEEESEVKNSLREIKSNIFNNKEEMLLLASIKCFPEQYSSEDNEHALALLNDFEKDSKKDSEFQRLNGVINNVFENNMEHIKITNE